MSDQFDPYLKWLGISPKDQPPNHYRLLGIDLFMDDPDVIEHAADRQMSHVRSFQSGKNAAHSQRLLNEIANAKVCLLDQEKKSAYDEQLKQSTGPTKKLAKAKALPQGTAAVARPAPSRANTPSGAMPSMTTVEPATTPAVSVSSGTTTGAPSLGRRPRRSPAPIIAAVGIGIAAIVGLIVFLNSGDAVNKETTSNDSRRPPQQTDGDAVNSTPAQQPTETVDPPAEPPPVQRVEPVVPNPPEADPEPQPPIVTPPTDPTTVELDGPDNDPPPQESDADRRIAIPDDEAQQAALNLIRETFQAENEKAKTPDEKRQLARLMFQAALDTQEAPSTRFVLLRVARDIATSSGDAEAMCLAVDKLAELFLIDGLEMKVQALVKAAPSLRSQDDSKQFVLAGQAIVQTAADSDRYDLATELSASLLDAARKLSGDDIELRKEVVALGKQIDEQAADYQVVENALAVLRDNPADAEANLVVGKYRCLEKGDWESGLPMLAKGSNPDLKAAAEQELAKPSIADDQIKLGDIWWDLADGETESAKTNMLSRAANWYALALPELASGLIKSKIEGRLEQIAAASEPAASEAGTTRRETVYLDDIQEFDFRVGFGTLGKHGKTGYPAGHEKSEVIFQRKKISHSLSTCPPSKSFAYVTYDLAGNCESFETVVGVMDRLATEFPRPDSPLVFKVLGDDRLLWQSNPIAEFSQGQECSIDVSNVRKLQLQVDCAGRFGRCHAAWINPRVTKITDAPKRSTKNGKLVYLDDAQEVSARVGYGSLGKHGQTGLGKGKEDFTFRQQRFTHSLFTHAPASVIYDLAGRGERFAVTVGLVDRSYQPASAVVFTVLGDDRVLWRSKSFTQSGQGEECSVDLSNVQKLELRVECSGKFNECHAVWLNPRVLASVDALPMRK